MGKEADKERQLLMPWVNLIGIIMAAKAEAPFNQKALPAMKP